MRRLPWLVLAALLTSTGCGVDLTTPDDPGGVSGDDDDDDDDGVVPTPPPSSKWTWANPHVSANSLFGVAFADASLGLAVGDLSLLRTTDGGASWESLPPPLDFLDGVAFVSPTRALAWGFNLATDTQPYSPSAAVSDDAGLTWTLHAYPALPGLMIFDVAVDGLDAVAIGIQEGDAANPDVQSAVLLSRDGGETWEDVSPVESTWLSGVDLHGERIRIVGGDQVLLSDDLGATWDVAPPIAGAELVEVDFRDDLVGLAVGYGQDVWKTLDGGTSWTPVHDGGAAPLLRSVRWLDATHVIATGWYDTAIASADGGASWSPVAPPSSAWLAATASSGSTVWMVGTRGRIFRSNDWGLSWQEQTSGFSASFARAAFPDALHGFAVGELGGIVRTADGGATWQLSLAQYHVYAEATPNPSFGMNTLRGVFFLDANRGWAVGDPVRTPQGAVLAPAVILHTLDGGNTWQLQNSGVQTSLQSVGFASQLIGWAVGYNVLLRTNNGGGTWISVPPPDGLPGWDPLTDIAVISETEAWVCGWNVLYHTTDGGLTWQRVPKQVGLLSGIRFSDALHGIASGSAPSLQTGFEVTSDGGVTWTTVEVPFAQNLATAVAMDDENKFGFAALHGGEILRTADGGLTWERDVSLTHNNLFDIRRTDSGFVAVGEFGSILIRPPELE